MEVSNTTAPLVSTETLSLLKKLLWRLMEAGPLHFDELLFYGFENETKLMFPELGDGRLLYVLADGCLRHGIENEDDKLALWACCCILPHVRPFGFEELEHSLASVYDDLLGMLQQRVSNVIPISAAWQSTLLCLSSFVECMAILLPRVLTQLNEEKRASLAECLTSCIINPDLSGSDVESQSLILHILCVYLYHGHNFKNMFNEIQLESIKSKCYTNLMSHHHMIRQYSLTILKRLPSHQDDSTILNTLEHCLKIELMPLDMSNSALIIHALNRLSASNSIQQLSVPARRLTVHYLLGLLHCRFTPLHEPIIRTIATYATDQLSNAIVDEQFWVAFSYQFTFTPGHREQWSTQSYKEDELSSVKKPPTEFFVKALSLENVGSRAPNWILYRQLLWKLLAACPQQAFRKNALLLSNFLSFVKDNLHVKNKIQQTLLISMLETLATFPTLSSIYKEEEIVHELHKLLCCNVYDVQSSVFEVLSAPKKSILRQYQDFFQRLLDKKTIRDTLRGFDAMTLLIHQGHRGVVIETVCRIIYGRINCRDKSFMHVIFSFLAQKCTPEEITNFLWLLLEPFVHVFHLNESIDDLSSVRGASWSNICPPPINESNFLDCVKKLCSGDIGREQLPSLARIQFIVQVIESIWKYMRNVITDPQSHLLLHLLLVVTAMCLGRLQPSNRDTELNETMADDVEEDEEELPEEENQEEVEKPSPVKVKRGHGTAKTIRKMCHKLLVSVFKTMPELEWTDGLLTALHLAALNPYMDATRSDYLHEANFPLKLCLVWSQKRPLASKLIKPSMLEFITALLQQEALSESVGDVALQILHNLIFSKYKDVSDDEDNKEDSTLYVIPQLSNDQYEILIDYLSRRLESMRGSKGTSKAMKKKFKSSTVANASTRALELLSHCAHQLPSQPQRATQMALALLSYAVNVESVRTLRRSPGQQGEHLMKVVSNVTENSMEIDGVKSVQQRAEELSISPEEWTQVSILKTILSLVSVSTDSLLILKRMLPLFSRIESRATRNLCCQLFQHLWSTLDLSSTPLKSIELPRMIFMLNSWDKLRVQDPDYESRCVAMQECRKFFVNEILPLQGNRKESGEDFLLEVEHTAVLCVSHNIIYNLHHNTILAMDNAVRDYFYELLNGLATLAPTPDDNSLANEIVLQILMAAIKYGLHERYRNIYVELLRLMSRTFSHWSQFTILSQLDRVEEEEISFFDLVQSLSGELNAKGLRKLVRFLRSERSSGVPIEYVRYLLLPIVLHFLHASLTGADELIMGDKRKRQWQYEGSNSRLPAREYNRLTACVDCIGAVFALFPWGHYKELLKARLYELKNAQDKPMSESHAEWKIKCLIAILQSFHFELNVSESQIDVYLHGEAPVFKNKRKAKKLSQAVDDYLGAEDAGGESKEKPVEVSKMDSSTEKVFRFVHLILLPRLEDLLSVRKKRLAHKLGQQTSSQAVGSVIDENSSLQAPIALAIMQICQQMPLRYLRRTLHRIVLRICEFLRSKEYETRAAAGETLSKILLALSNAPTAMPINGTNSKQHPTPLGKHLAHILQVVDSQLQLGNSRFVRLHTQHCVLRFCVDKKIIAPGDLDFCLEAPLQCYFDEVFGDMGLEKKTRSRDTMIEEAKKGIRAYDGIAFIGAFCSVQALPRLFAKLTEKCGQLMTRENVTHMELLLQHLTSKGGIFANPALQDDFILQCANKLVTDSLKELERHQIQEREDSGEIPTYDLRIPKPPGRDGVKTVEKRLPNCHILASCGFKIVLTLFKTRRARNDKTDISLALDPFVSHVDTCLSSNYTQLIETTVRLTAALIPNRCPSFDQKLSNISSSLFKLLTNQAVLRGSGGRSSQKFKDFIGKIYKALAALLYERKDFQLSTMEYGILLDVIDIETRNPNRLSNASFTLLRAVLSKKLKDRSYAPLEKTGTLGRSATKMKHGAPSQEAKRDRLSDIMDSLQRICICDTREMVREQARSCLLTYLRDYPHSDHASLWKRVEFYLHQLRAYALPSEGRESACTMIEQILRTFPQSFLLEEDCYVALWMVFAHAAELEPFQHLRERKLLLMKELLEHLPQERADNLFKTVVLPWLDDGFSRRPTALLLALRLLPVVLSSPPSESDVNTKTSPIHAQLFNWQRQSKLLGSRLERLLRPLREAIVTLQEETSISRLKEQHFVEFDEEEGEKKKKKIKKKDKVVTFEETVHDDNGEEEVDTKDDVDMEEDEEEDVVHTNIEFNGNLENGVETHEKPSLTLSDNSESLQQQLNTLEQCLIAAVHCLQFVVPHCDKKLLVKLWQHILSPLCRHNLPALRHQLQRLLAVMWTRTLDKDHPLNEETSKHHLLVTVLKHLQLEEMHEGCDWILKNLLHLDHHYLDTEHRIFLWRRLNQLSLKETNEIFLEEPNHFPSTLKRTCALKYLAGTCEFRKTDTNFWQEYSTPRDHWLFWGAIILCRERRQTEKLRRQLTTHNRVYRRLMQDNVLLKSLEELSQMTSQVEQIVSSIMGADSFHQMVSTLETERVRRLVLGKATESALKISNPEVSFVSRKRKNASKMNKFKKKKTRLH